MSDDTGADTDEDVGRISEVEGVVTGDLSEEDVTPCPDCDSETGEPLNGESACMSEGCDVGAYLPDGTVLYRI